MNENLVLAKKIYEIEHGDRRARHDIYHAPGNGYPLLDNVYLELSADGLTINLWKHFEDQARPFFKGVPNYEILTVDEIRAILKAQHWSCI